MSELKYFKGEDWEVKLKYNEDFKAVVWGELKGRIPNQKRMLVIDRINESIYGIFKYAALSKEPHYKLFSYLNTLTQKEIETELTYNTVVKELEGLEGQELYEAMKKYEWNEVYTMDGKFEFQQSQWCLLTYFDYFLDKPNSFKRGLIKLRRVK